MHTIYSEDHRLHDGNVELFEGKVVKPHEMPRRADIVLNRVKSEKLGDVVAPQDFGIDPILGVHDKGLVEFLRDCWSEWTKSGRNFDALPHIWPTPGLLPPNRSRADGPRTQSIDGKLGFYGIDAGTPIIEGTWRAVYTSAQVALTGQRLVATGERAAFALCRPPGHHAGSDFYGGYCFLNNAAIAAQAFRDAGAKRVAILDVDYHHGNGTQQIFYERADVLTISIHADPKQEFPYFLGHADERGEGRGEGFHLNLPLPWGIGWAEYGTALDTAMRRLTEFAPDAIVVSLGVDTFEKDPISKFKLKHEDYIRIGEAVAAAGKPTLFVMEGGYAVEELGVNAVNVLQGFES
jgi:acetoin utilization deacetylase AcuC-like enzyme